MILDEFIGTRFLSKIRTSWRLEVIFSKTFQHKNFNVSAFGHNGPDLESNGHQFATLSINTIFGQLMHIFLRSKFFSSSLLLCSADQQPPIARVLGLDHIFQGKACPVPPDYDFVVIVFFRVLRRKGTL